MHYKKQLHSGKAQAIQSKYRTNPYKKTGPAHPETLTIMENLIQCCEKSGNTKQQKSLKLQINQAKFLKL